MKRLITMTAAGLLVLAGCSTFGPGQAGVEIQSSKDVLITNVHIDQMEGGVMVHGSLRPKNNSVTRVGHVDVEFIRADGEVLQMVKADTNTDQFSRKSARRPTFSATAEIEGFASVRLEHHPDTLQQCDL
ncbi:hypothetical protein [Pontiella agarivorans]|uniref:Lipoprotein n=1 Tax=Pontiella agarivorans TaxID=3038953 RepID=A0ABU5MWX7_9BACT|nr:hypothetical protein [Pontiella agarivorans]MDZ8118680.1 hypothetical protein [Pontiella agarivorans]